MSEPVPEIVHVLITREAFIDYFMLTMDDGASEELEVEETREWFRSHGANMDVVEKALDHCWNFHRAEVNIKNFRRPKDKFPAYAPKI